ncbi:MAG: HAMP domain-containing histidine kinase, partial [Candidatus Omnitrophica bacterium]|nr:HAMP domain-containing histidine kinase [Candidatus Omnitrophota bacterium]
GVAIFLLFICGIGLAWMVANRAMKGVRRVTQTAKNIRHEGFHHRVQEGMEGTEIQELAVTFNNMLNRIESLIMELKDVTNNLAHDLRTPLTRIRGQAETALRVDQPNMKSYEEVIGTVVEECDRLVQMINTTLEIAQIESGIDNVDHCAVDLVDIVQKGCNVFLPLAQDKEIQLKIHCPQEPVCVLGSVPRLQRVMSNLLDNAIKFTGEGGQVDVTLKAHGTNAVLSVKDTGIGIPSNQQEHIFEKFYRAESSRSTPGSGLGLSYVKSMISSLAGNISVSSTPGQGSTFIAEIPLVKPQ